MLGLFPVRAVRVLQELGEEGDGKYNIQPGSKCYVGKTQYKARYGPSGRQIRDYIIRADIEEVADHIPQS